MIDFATQNGTRALERLNSELCVWLTTLSSDDTPQPRPVWFIWHNQGFIILSRPDGAKLKHIAANPKVALNFDGGFEGEDIQVFTGTASSTVTDRLSADEDAAYYAKYHDPILGLGMTDDSFRNTYSQVIRVTPEKLR